MPIEWPSGVAGKGNEAVAVFVNQIRNSIGYVEYAYALHYKMTFWLYRLGLIGAPSRVCQALAPLGFGLLLEPLGRGVLAVSSLLGALVALLLLPHADRRSARAASPAE